MNRAESCRWRFSSLLSIALFLIWSVGPTCLHSQTISGTVQDPSGAVIAGARIEIVGARSGGARRAFVGRTRQICVSRSETRNIYSAGDPGWLSSPRHKTADLRRIRPTATLPTIAKQQVNHLGCWKESGIRQLRSCLPAAPPNRTGANVSLRQFRFDVGHRNVPVSERDSDFLESGEWSCNRSDLHRGRTFQPKAGYSSRRPRTQPTYRRCRD
jgi:hypothetical protein